MPTRNADLRHGSDAPIGGINLSDDDDDDEYAGEETFATDVDVPPVVARAYAASADPPSTNTYQSYNTNETSVLEIPETPQGNLWDQSMIRMKGEGVQDAPPMVEATPPSSPARRASAHYQPVRPAEPGQLQQTSSHGSGSGGNNEKRVARRPSDAPQKIDPSPRRQSDGGIRKAGLRQSGHHHQQQQQPGAFNEANQQRSPAAPAPAPLPPPPPLTPAPAPAPTPSLPVADDVIVADATLVKPVADVIAMGDVETPSNMENQPRTSSTNSDNNNNEQQQKTLMYFTGLMFLGLILVLVVVVVVVVMLTRPSDPPAPAPTAIDEGGASNFPTTVAPDFPTVPVPDVPTVPAPEPDAPIAPAPEPDAPTAPAPEPVAPEPATSAPTTAPSANTDAPTTTKPSVTPTTAPSAAPSMSPSIGTLPPTAATPEPTTLAPTSSPTNTIVTPQPTSLPPTPFPTLRPTLPPTTPQPTPFPTLRPTLPPTTPQPTPFPTAEATTFVDTLPDFTQVAILQDPASAQSRAWDWLRLRHPLFRTMAQWQREQLFALATFFYSYNGADWSSSEGTNWLNGNVDECLWGDSGSNANRCNDNGRITKLSLEEETVNEVVGVTPPELILLTDLQDLRIFTMDLVTNFEGVLPTQLANLTDLSNLHLYNLEVTGTLPSYIADFQQLTSLNIRSNQLTGPLPTELGLMTNLRFLVVRSNSFAGTLPTEMANMASLESLTINENGLTGTIPSALCALPSLTTIRLDCLKLVAPVACDGIGVICDDADDDAAAPATPAPAPVANTPTAATAFPTTNTLVLGVPEFSLAALQDASSPQFAANAWLAGWTEYFVPECEWGDTGDPNECNAQGEITTLSVEFVDEFVGIAMPPELALLSSLEKLVVESNSNLVADVSAMLPAQLVHLPLSVIFMENNAMTGTLPSQLFGMSGLTNLRLNGNQISGPIPSEISSLQELRFLSLFNNPLTGEIPSELGLMTNLVSIVLDQTLMSGTVPHEVCDLPLQLLDIDCTMIEPPPCAHQCGNTRETRD
ncbi:Leucine Rich Repeat [Seminavis robusta]|uniref:Leucine Rich Repeat n=1 Tax=Seminavis robusta TaxID=568900 RepID=A0A9N8E9I7_9STRA|nr:Leucine Rich Repeat [Seminavis robusta]|eukprot:Sro843_g209780.1 Leucine Rich Repeat (1030) ;mRNA; r:59-3259